MEEVLDVAVYPETEYHSYRLELLRKGELVSRVRVVPKIVRIGSIRLNTAGIVGLRTPEAERLRGYGSRMMHEAVAWMQHRGYSLSLLDAIPDFYHRFGYVVVFHNARFTLQAKRMASAQCRHAIRAVRLADLPEMVRLHNRVTAGRTGLIVRRTDWSFGRLRTPPFKMFKVLTPSGKIAGYASGRPWPGRGYVVVEAIGSSPTVFETIIAEVTRRARQSGWSEVIFGRICPDDPFAEFCTRYGPAWDVECPYGGNGMGRILHLQDLICSLGPEFERRRADSALLAGTQLEIQCDGKRVTVPESNGAGDVLSVTIPPGPLLQLILGYRGARDVAGDAGVKIPRHTLPIADALFPKKVSVSPVMLE